MIKPSDISVVVQGPIAGRPGDAPGLRHTEWCLESVRTHLPGAELILSTWEGADVTGLSYDRLIENVDPGPMNCTLDPTQGPQIYDNTHRQLLSTRSGLAVATRPYSVKLRSDMVFEGRGFLDYFGQYRARADAWRVLGERVVTSTHYARNARRAYRYPFHPSDWFFFGRSEDVAAIWDVPPPAEPESSRWFDTHPLDEAATYFDPPTVYRYSVEQYVWTTFLRKHGPVPFEHRSDATPEMIALSELTIANNLVMVDPEHLQVRFVKYGIEPRDRASVFSEADWLDLYRTYCGPEAAADAALGPIGRPRPATRVTPAQLSVIVPGPDARRADGRQRTLRALQGIRRHLPEAEIVLTARPGDAAADLPHDVLVAVDAAEMSGPAGAGAWSEVNARITATCAGLRAASRPYAVNLARDAVLTGAGFLQYAYRYDRRAPKWRLLRDRVVVPTTFSRDPRRRPHALFHPSAWFHFGRRDDLLAMWDVPLAGPEESLSGHTPEQYLWTRVLRKYDAGGVGSTVDAGPAAVDTSELTLANNLVIAAPATLGVRWVGRSISPTERVGFYTHREWELLYAWYCQSYYQASTDAADWAKRVHAAFASPRETLAPVRNSKLVSRVIAGWEARSPATYRATRLVARTAVRGLRRGPAPRADGADPDGTRA